MWDFGEDDYARWRPVRVNDLAFFKMLLRTLTTRYPIDADRVFATGISRGGMATYFLACRLPRRIRAIAAFAMPLPAFLEDDCTGEKAVGVMVVNGTADPVVPYGGGAIRVFGRKSGRVWSTRATVRLWRKRNECRPDGRRVDVIDRARDGMEVHRLRYGNCRGAPVVRYRIEGGGHTWPSGLQYFPAFLVGGVCRDIDGAEAAWRFFSEFP
jgi:polyhydroxybutyrate depolymerase